MSSKSTSSNSTTTEDNRIIADGRGIAVNSDGGSVALHMVPDEAFDFAEQALFEASYLIDSGNNRASDLIGTTLNTTTRHFAEALEKTQSAAQSESKQLAEQVIKIGIPVLGLAFLAGKIFK